MTQRILNWGWLLLAALAPLGTRYIAESGSVAGVAVEWGTVSLYGTQLLLAGLILAVAGQAWTARKDHEPLDRSVRLVLAAALGLALATTISVLVAPLGISAGSWLVLVWVMLGGLWLSATAFSRTTASWPLAGLAVGGVFQAVLAVHQFLTQTISANKWLGLAAQNAADLGTFVVETGQGRWLRAYGTLGHPNLLGFYLVLAIVAVIGLLLLAARERRARWLWAALPLLGFGLATTYSRSALLAALAAAIVLPLTLMLIKRRGPARLAFAGFTAAFVAALILVTLAPQLLQTRTLGAGRLEIRSNQERVSQAQEAVQLGLKRPLTGIGPSQMPQAVAEWLPDSRSPYAYQPVHNVPLLLWVEVGLGGLLVWLALIALAVGRLIRALPRHRANRYTADIWLPATGLALLAALLTVSAFDHYLWSLWPGQLAFWIVVSFSLFKPAGAGR
jgi:hypothetical protein